MSTSEEPDLRVQWPYKYLWNVLRGESIVADDDVILQELRVSYDRILLGLTQFPGANKNDKASESEDKNTSVLGTPTTTTTTGNGVAPAAAGTTDTTSIPPTGETAASGDKPDNEKKLRKRISLQLDLEENVAWDVFVGYMMFEYRGGSTSFEKLLDQPRVSTDFLADLQQFYQNERLSVLLVIQAIFGYASQADHKYNHIFESVCDWVKEDEAAKVTENLVKSLEMVRDPQEEIQVLNSLTLFTYHMPVRGVTDFCKEFQSFRPGLKDTRILVGEAALMFTLVNFPLLQEAEEEVTQELREAVEQFLERNADDLLMNDYNKGAVLSGYFSTCFKKNNRIKDIIGHPKHRLDVTFSTMLNVAETYAADSVENNRNNLPNVVLKSLFFALRSLATILTEERIFRCGSPDEFYQLATVLLDHSEVAALLCSDEGSVLQMMVFTAMSDFPLKLKNMTNIWGSLCAANARLLPNQCIPLLKDYCKMVTTLAECVDDQESIKEILGLHTNGYKLVAPRVVAGIQLPFGTELDHMDEDAEKNLFTLYWRIPNNVVIDVFSVINNQLLVPIANELQTGGMANTPVNALVKWVHDENQNVWSVLKFLIKYASCAPAITETLRQQYEPMAFIVFKTLDYISQWKMKAKLCSNLIELLVAANKFGVQGWSHVYFSEVWPTTVESSSYISDIIMGYESVANNECVVTIAFLQSVQSFFKGGGGVVVFGSELEEKIAHHAIDFVVENVFHSFTRWRFSTAEAKYKILLHSLKVYSCVFDVESVQWTKLKDACARSLLSPNSSLMTVLSSTEDGLQLSVLQPTRENCLIPEIIYHSLAVLLKLFQFQSQSIRLVDESLGSTLVQKLGRFARHRLDYKIPTLAISLLKKIAEEMNMSLLSCFGSEEVAFRDLISQRLEFRSEDVNLKISILDFLTVAAHTQPGLIQFVFMDDFLAQKIVELPTEKDEGLAVAVLCFIRAMFRKGASVVKKCQNLWDNVFYPINQLRPGGRIKIVTCTLNIASLELFRFGIINTKFASEIKALLKEENFIHLLQMALSERRDTSGKTKCLSAFKHFISVVLHRNDLEDSFNDEMRHAVLDVVTREYWTVKENEITDPQAAKVLVDLMCQLVSCMNDTNIIGDYLIHLSGRLSKHFFEDSVPVQIGTLRLVNICMKKVPGSSLASTTLENILRVISHVFDNASKIFKHVDENLDSIGPLITLSASLVITIVKTVDASEWQTLFHRYTIPHLIVHATHEGIDKCRREDIIMELLYVLLKMAEVKECAESLISGLIIQKVFILVLRNAERTSKELPKQVSSKSDGTSEWTKIYLVTLQIITQMLRTEKIFFVEHNLNLWGSHGSHIIDQLNSLPAMTMACKMNQHDYNFRMMKNLLTFNVYALDAICAMIPFWKHWTLNNNYEHLRVLDAVFTAMQTSVNLLDQPQYLQSFISYTHSKSNTFIETRPTPQLLELNSKLWDVINLSTFIFWSLRTWTVDVFEHPKILSASNQVAQACITAISKPERGSHPSGGHSHSHSYQPVTATTSYMARILNTLERSLTMYLFHGKRTLEDPAVTTKQRQSMMREFTIDIGTLCDGTRRVTTLHPNPLLDKLCHSLETTFK